MPTRRSFLQSAVFLPSLLAADAFAQDTQNSKAVPFADFENGWGDWTTEGLAFGDHPATDTLFPGKINGFGGHGFVCTLHPRKGNAATGKAVSREFVIEKPFITFKMGGGNFPGQACLNLVVDGKTERTATGDGTASLSEKSWDVSALVGKKARLEIVDNTISEQRGYVLVDDIAFLERLPMRPQKMLEQFQIRPQFVPYSRFFQNEDEKINGRWLDFGVPDDRIDELTKAIWLMVCNSQYAPYRDVSVAVISKWTEEITKTVTRTEGLLSELGRQWLMAEAICAWCTVYVERDVEMDRAIARGEQVNTRDTQYPINVLHSMPPKAICNGYSLIIREVARKLGLTCHIVKGYLRVDGKDALWGKHQWSVFTFPGNVLVPADGGPGDMSEVVKYKGKIYPYAKLPRLREEWELYHSAYFNLSPIPWPLLFGESKESVVLLDMSLEQWASTNIHSYKPIFQRLVHSRPI